MNDINPKKITTITTLEVAEMLGTRHYKVLEKLDGTKDGKTKGIIEILTAHDFVVSDYFMLSTYKDNKEAAAPYIEAAENLFQRAIEDGWNADGAPGIVYTTDWDGKPVVHDRMHWTLAEAMNTSAILYHVTGKEKYAEDYAAFMQYLDEDVLDHESGSWFHQLDRENHVIGTVWPGKSDIYHALQATLIPYCAPDVSVAKATAMGLEKH